MTKTNRHVQNMTNINKTGRKCVKLSFNKYAHSSNVNEVIRAILNPFIFFFTRRFHTHKKHKMHRSQQKPKGQHFYAHKKHLRESLQKDFTHKKSTKRIQANKNKKDSIFMHIKNI